MRWAKRGAGGSASPQRPGRARAFYATIAAATVVGAALNFTPLDPIKALFWSAVINGVAAVPIMVMIMLMASRRAVMGQFTLAPWLKALGWLATAVMAAAADRHVRDLGRLRLRATAEWISQSAGWSRRAGQAWAQDRLLGKRLSNL